MGVGKGREGKERKGKRRGGKKERKKGIKNIIQMSGYKTLKYDKRGGEQQKRKNNMDR